MQLIVCRSKDGIVLGADGRAVVSDRKGELEIVHLRRIFPLGKHAALLVGTESGAVPHVERMVRAVEKASDQDVRWMVRTGMDVLGSVRHGFGDRGRIPFQEIWVVAGVHREPSGLSFEAFILAQGSVRRRVEVCKVSWAFTWPPRKPLEYRLRRMSLRGAPIGEILREVRSGMENLTWYKQDVGGPHQYALITREGFRAVDAGGNQVQEEDEMNSTY